MTLRFNPAARTIRLVTANNVVHFLAEVHWPARIETGLGIGRLGRTSYVVSTALFVGEDCVGLCDTVLVMLGDDGPLPVPEDARARLGEGRRRAARALRARRPWHRSSHRTSAPPGNATAT